MEIIKADTIEQYNRFFGFPTKHPLVGIVHFDRSENLPTHKMTFGFYALFLKKTVGCTINYGKTKYDFDDETVVIRRPFLFMFGYLLTPQASTPTPNASTIAQSD